MCHNAYVLHDLLSEFIYTLPKRCIPLGVGQNSG